MCVRCFDTEFTPNGVHPKVNNSQPEGAVGGLTWKICIHPGADPRRKEGRSPSTTEATAEGRIRT